MACRNLTAAAIAEYLHAFGGDGSLDRDVIDATSLEGAWDFDLVWTPREALAAKGSAGVPLLDAVDKQLGLKLERKDAPLPSLVVERVNRKPTPNPAGVATALAVAAAQFEVASIRPANPDQRAFVGLQYSGGSQMRAGGTLRGLLGTALQIRPNVAADMIVGLPKSADGQQWDITAKLPSTGDGAPSVINGRLMPPPMSTALEMLRALLVERFELKMHIESRETTVYALTLAGSKPKLTRADDSERSGCKLNPNVPKPFPNVSVMIACNNTMMSDLAQSLQLTTIDHPIVDETGLQGGWDFLVGWTARSLLQPPAPEPSPPAGAVVTPADPGAISFFDALEKELGLKLLKQKRSIPVVVIDHVNEKPTE